MQRHYQKNDYSLIENYPELTRQTAFHEAGHAVAIYLGNRQKCLPPTFFQILLRKPVNEYDRFFAKVEGGRLIQSFPLPIPTDHENLTTDEQTEFRCAYEADVVNLLVGPLAEAKYISIRDDEIFNRYLLNTDALKYYGGSSDLETVSMYMENLIPSQKHREEQLLELFNQAFQFIDSRLNWECICNLAKHILQNKQHNIPCEEVIAVCDRQIN